MHVLKLIGAVVLILTKKISSKIIFLYYFASLKNCQESNSLSEEKFLHVMKIMHSKKKRFLRYKLYLMHLMHRTFSD